MAYEGRWPSPFPSPMSVASILPFIGRSGFMKSRSRTSSNQEGPA